MLRKSALFFFVIVLSGVFLPLAVLAVETYDVQLFEDSNENGRFDQGETTSVATLRYEGFVPCGKCLDIVTFSGNAIEPIQNLTADRCNKQKVEAGGQVYLHCQLCHFFVMINQFIAFLLITIIPPLAILMLVIGGVMFYFGGAKPDLIARGRKLIVSVAIGLFLIYGAYMIIGLLLTIVGAADVGPISNIFENGVFSIDCPIRIPLVPPAP